MELECVVLEPRRQSYALKTVSLFCKIPVTSGGLSSWWSRQPADDSVKYVLKDVSCEAMQGEITAIAGPSGAGKTTLLEIMAGVGVSSGRVSGQILVNDQPMNAGRFRRVSGYVSQEEALFPLLTVEETLFYSARLRLHADAHRARVRVHDLLKDLKLDHVASSRVGDSGSSRGISGGEKRRVSIGVDMVHDPAVLLIDEPTSGLDSASALHVMLLLKSMAVKQGKTIVLCIHQPGFRILELFDQVVLLSNGSVVHRGPLHLLEETLKSVGHSIPDHVNVLEFAMDVTDSLVTHLDKHQDRAPMTPDHEHHNIRVHPNSYIDSENHISFANSRFHEILILGKRFCSNIFRAKQLFAAKTLQAVLVGIVLGTIFMNLRGGSTGRLNLQTRIGFFAFSLTFLLSATTEGLPIFLRERKILMRETSRGAYRISSYVVSNTLVFIPFLLVVAILYAVPVYWFVGLRKGLDGFLYFLLVVWIVILTSNSFVACFSALVPDFIMGTSVIAGVMGSYFLFSGYFIAKGDIPWYWSFMHYLSLFKYPFECFMINEFGGKSGWKICVQSVGGECIMYGSDFLMHQGLKESQKWSNVWVMIGFIFMYRLLSYLILLYRSHKIKG
uniref:ABC transporter domain-containing protein n=1 Tax=Kalanchoe fedtschenkoi TaxID=63787 RepID=A0A7N0T2C7_KALFE